MQINSDSIYQIITQTGIFSHFTMKLFFMTLLPEEFVKSM